MSEETGSQPEVTTMKNAAAETVQADTVTMVQSGATNVAAEHINIRMGGVVKCDAKTVDIQMGGVVISQSEAASLHASQANVVAAQGDVSMELSGSVMLFANGSVAMNQSGAVVLAARTIDVRDSNPIFLLASQVNGDVKTQFGPLESVLVGAAAGLAMGVFLLIASGLKKVK